MIRDNIAAIYPMSDIQKGMVLYSMINPAKGMYHDQFVYQIPKVEVALFKQALTLMVEKHSILRTWFDLESYRKEVQLVEKEVTFDIDFSEVSHLNASEQEAHIKNYIEEERTRPFDFKKAPLWRASIFQISASQCIFLFQFHHSILDGWSVASLNTELFHTYLELEKNSNYKPEPLKASFKEAIIEEMAEKNNKTTIEYWKTALADYKRLDLFTSTPTVKSFSKVYDQQFLATLRDTCQKDGISLQSLFLGAFIYALKMLNYQEDMLVGLVSNNRPTVEDGDKILGCFLNTLPFRVQLDQYKQSSWAAYFKGIGQKLHELKTKGRLTLLEIAKITEEQAGEENPFFDVIFNYVDFHVYNNINQSATDSNAASEERLNIESFESTNTTLDLNVSLTGGEIGFLYKLDQELKSGLSLEQLHGFVDQILNYYLAQEIQEIQQYELLASKDKHQILQVFNDTQIDYPKGKTILDLYRAQVEKAPDAIAIEFENHQVSFAELDRLSNQMAAYLIEKHDLKENDLVGMKLERSEWMLITILSILKAGAAYLPIDTHHPAERAAYIQEDSNFKVCIDAQELEKIKSDLAQNSYQRTLPTVTLDHLAYAIYTSGSTGNPKGVVNDHAGLYNRLLWMRDDLAISAEDVLIQKTPYTFDVSVWELIMPLITGSKLVFAKPEGHKDPYYLQQLIEEKAVNIIHFVPSMLGAFLAELEVVKCASLRHVVCSGEALPVKMVEKFRAKLPACRIHNLYGPTEAAIDVTAIDLTKTDLGKAGVSIGAPVANTQIYIVNQAMQLQSIGVPGELLIGGVQVSRGYLNRPTLNQNKFVKNPFDEGKVYRTGDLAKWLPDGNIAFLGRMDNQVKIRGNRIELGEIENAFQQSDLIRQCVVLVNEDQSGNKRLVAYVLTKEGYDKTLLYQHLNKQLPDYMVPSFIMELEEFPVTTNGKLNRKALPEPGHSLETGSEYLAPRNEVEEKMATIWQDILDIDQVGINDNFFQIGGDSIISIRTVSRMNKLLKTDIKVGQLYEYKTIAHLAESLNQNSAEANKKEKRLTQINQSIEALKAKVLGFTGHSAEIEDVYPMGDIQKGMVLLSMVNPEAAVYHDQFVFEIPRVDLDYFKKALAAMVEKHTTLRTTFDLENFNQEIQIVQSNISYTVHHSDISSLAKEEQKQAIQNYLGQERQKPFDFKSAPLWRAAIFHTSHSQSVFVFQFHHAILDGWSLASLNTELFNTYHQLQQNITYKPQPLKANYKVGILEELYEKTDQRNIDFWKTELESYKRLAIFSNQPSKETYVKDYDLSFVQQLKERSQEDGLIMKTVIFGAFAYALNLLTFEDDLVLGLVSNNRPVVEDGDKILGCFLNTLPVRVQLDKTNSWLDFMNGLEQKMIQLKTRGRLTLLEIARLAGERVADENPFFDVLFNFMDFHIYNDIQAETSGENPSLDIASYESTNTMLDLDVSTTADGLSFRYATTNQLKSNIALQQLHTYVDKVLHYYIEQPAKKLQTSEFISAAEQQQVLYDFNDTTVAYSPDKSIIDLFKKQVEEQATKAALVFEGKVFSYRELDQLSDELAAYLMAQHSVRAEDYIGIRLERSEWMIISILAVLKTGATYIPIAYDYPKDRVDYILEDSKAKLIVEQEILDAFEKWEKVDHLQTPRIKAAQLAYIIYTSGSTGRPKGVMISHASLVDYAETTKRYFALDANDRVIQQASIAFDTSIEEIFPILIAGGTLFVQKDRKDIEGLIEECERNHITVLSTIPYVLKYLNDNYQNYQIDFRILISGGDTLKYNYVDRLVEKYSVYNTYGPTESTVCASYYKVKSKDTNIPIGKAIANRKLYILDQNNALLPIGVVGELCISGTGLAKGYLNQEALTEEKFIPHPFIEGERLYKTGDLARYWPDGNVEFFGRKDEQIKIRGNRIEFGEIEQQLASYPDIEEVVASTYGDGEDKILIAYYTAAKELTNRELSDFLAETVPSYMIPSFFQFLDHIPQSNNGKIDKKALPAPVVKIGDNYLPPTNATEEKLVRLWSELLKLDREVISVNKSFFELGGHSLKVVTMVSKIEKEFNVKLKLQSIFTTPTIKDISNTILMMQITKNPKKSKLKLTV